MGYPVTKNRMTNGGDTWLIGGQIDREGAPALTALNVMLLQRYEFAPAALSAVAVHAAIALTAAIGGQDIITAIGAIDFPRTVTVKGNASGITGNVVITGTDILDAAITDTIALSGSSEVEGVRAFKTVTNIHVPPEVHAGTDTVSVGWGKKFGITHILPNTTLLLIKNFDGAADTSGSLAVDAAISKCLYALDGTPNGVKTVALYYLV